MQSASTQTIESNDAQTDFGGPTAPAPAPTPTQPQKEYISYSKGVQTEPYTDVGVGTDDSVEEIPSPRARKRLSRLERDRDEEIREQIRKEIEEELKVTQNGTLGDQNVTSTQQRFPLRPLTDTELNAVTSSTEFLSFIERSSKVIERALDDDYDLLADYTRTSTLNDDDDDDPYSQSKKSYSIRETQQFFSERHSRKRMVTDLDFSPHFNELLLTSYTKNPSAPNEPAGLVLLWNVHSPSRPEYVFTAGTDVLSARFSPFHPNLIVGGCYSGQICLWDTRQSGRSGQPVQKTPQNGQNFGHTHPVYNVNMTGTQNAHNIITTSMDGTLCSWSFDMLSQAQEYVELRTPLPSKIDDLAPTCMSFPVADPTFFLVGTEEGNIYPCHRYDRAGAKAGVDSRLTYYGHTAPVMSTQFHPAKGPVDLGDLVLSSSSDWSIKLWRVKPAATSNAAAAVANQYGNANSSSNYIDPILDIQMEDLVYDAKWSPHKPSVFAAVTGAGELDIFDLNNDIEVPVAKATPTRGTHGVVPFKGLNKVAWEERKGGLIATGGLDGMVSLFEVGRGLRGEASEIPTEEWTSMKKLVSRLEAESGRGGTATSVL